MIFKSLVYKIIKAEKAEGLVDVSLIGDKAIQLLNWKFRKKDKPTDVLAFPYGEGRILGDVIISRETARKNAVRFKTAFRSELKRLVIHGVLHVLGYDHGRKMRSAEEVYSKL